MKERILEYLFIAAHEAWKAAAFAASENQQVALEKLAESYEDAIDILDGL